VTRPFPVSAHELVVFLVPAHAVTMTEPAIDGLVDAVRAASAAPNTTFAWVVVGDAVRAARDPAPVVRGRELVPYAAGGGGPVDLPAGLVVALDLAHLFLTGCRDGLPAAVDLLVAVDADRHPPQATVSLLDADRRVAAGFAVRGDLTAVNPLGYAYTVGLSDWRDLGGVWSVLRPRLQALRRPETVHG
jgi:hypothetical protein